MTKKPDRNATTPSEAVVDDQVVVQARTQRESLGMLYDATYPLVFRYCLRRTGQRSLAEDIVSSVFLNVATKMADFPGTTFIDFRRWVFRITTNELNAHHRQSARRQTLMMTAVQSGQVSRQVSGEPALASDACLADETLQAALARLDDRDREILSMRFFAELPYHDIAAILEMTPGAVRTAASRCLTKLRLQIKDLQ